MPTASKYVATYLNDHLAGAAAALELVKRAASENEGTELGDFLASLKVEIEADKQALEDIMSTLGASRDHAKLTLAWLGEKAGRLKLNGQLLGYSPLSPLIELEVLMLGVTGKLGLWRALAVTLADRLPVDLLDELIARAESQRADIERHRLAVALVALRP